MVLKRLERGHNVILDIDVQGGLQVRKAMPEAVLIFILPPTLTELRSRLEGRKTETRDIIEKRLSKAVNEIRLIGEYDYLIVNDDRVVAAAKAASIMAAEDCRVPDKVRSLIREYEQQQKGE
jgi:guanylate kinase